jgi:hypothetical protein
MVCSHFHSECERLILAKKTLTLREGQLQHVGHKYDLFKSGKPLRIVISGIDAGALNMVTMDERYKQVVEDSGFHKLVRSASIERRRESHAVGTTFLLKVILRGKESIEGDGWVNWYEEFISNHEKNDEKPKKEDHIFNMMSLVNFLICCGTIGDTMNSNDTPPRVAYNCFPHYLKTLEILEPTLVIFQGKGWFSRCLKEARIDDCWKALGSDYGRFRYQGLEFIGCDFYHPSHRQYSWYQQNVGPTEYFKGTVVPTVLKACQALGI